MRITKVRYSLGAEIVDFPWWRDFLPSMRKTRDSGLPWERRSGTTTSVPTPSKNDISGSRCWSMYLIYRCLRRTPRFSTAAAVCSHLVKQYILYVIFLFYFCCPALFAMSMVCSTKVLCPQNLFSRKLQRYKGRIMWTYDICAFDTGMYYDCYCQKSRSFAMI